MQSGKFDASELIGETIGGTYEVLSFIESGGMSNVFKAKHKFLDRHCVLKIMLPDSQNPTSMTRFKREAKIVSRLNHPNICSVYEYLLDKSGHPVIVMEFLDGIALDRLLDASEFLSPVDSVYISMSILRALGYAHKLDIIHRDIKPGNVMVLGDPDENYDVKLLDFGIAKSLDPKSLSIQLTRTGEVFGTPLYLSPEQCLEQEIDNRSDIYAMGCFLYTILTGSPPFLNPNPVEVMKMHLSNPIDFSETNIAPSLQEVILKATGKKKDDRYQNAEEMFIALSKNEFCRKEISFE